MENPISPNYMMKLIQSIEKAILDKYPNDEDVEFLLKRWDRNEPSVDLRYTDFGHINLLETLHAIEDEEVLLKIAIDMGVETPYFIPSTPIFKNEIKEHYQPSFQSFDEALKHVEELPSDSIIKANTTLEGIIKEVMKNLGIEQERIQKKTLYKLTEAVLKEFELHPENSPIEIRNIGSALLTISQNIEKLRSEKTYAHGKISADDLVSNPLYAYFVINAVSSVGLFILSFYNSKYKKESKVKESLESNKLEPVLEE